MPDDSGLIATHYHVDSARPALLLQGGFRAWPVIDRRDAGLSLIAIETKPNLPARPRVVRAGGRQAVPHAVLPVEYGLGCDPSGKPGWFIVADALPAIPVRVGPQPWREADLISLVLQPAAAALTVLAAMGMTHRAINPDNLFRAGSRDPVTLGPFWAAPPASLQPAVYEPVYMARCLPNGRGEGVIADDVYSLGVTLLALHLGRVPLAELDEADMLNRKVALGSFAALTENVVLPPLLTDLLRSMLADDPDHRPPPALLMRPGQARARRVAARPPRRAKLPLHVGGLAVWTARELAWALGLHPERGHALLKSGEVERWLRRCLGDPQLGMSIEEVTRSPDTAGQDDVRAQGLMLMRAIAALDPLAPLIWRGAAVQPDGLGVALMGAPPETVSLLEHAILNEAVSRFHACSKRRPDSPGVREEQRLWRTWLSASGPAGGLLRLTYGANPMLPCASPLLGGRLVVRAAELLGALDQAAAEADRTRPPVDAHIAAFLAARLEPALAGDLARLTSFAGSQDRLTVLRLFGRLQERLHPDPLPGLAGWLVSSGMVSLGDWKNKPTRAALEERVDKAAQAGQIADMVDLVDDKAARQADAAGAKAAAHRIETLQDLLEEIAQAAPRRDEEAELLSYELVTGAGLIATLGAALALALP